MSRTTNLIGRLIVTLCLTTAAFAQTPPPSTPATPATPATPMGTASLAGQIKIGDKGVAGAVVSLASATNNAERQRTPPFAPPSAAGQAVTDADGRFQLNHVASGTFRVLVSAPGYVLGGSELTVQLADGQALQNINLTLSKGGVITGKVTSNFGGGGARAVIGEPVTLTPLNAAMDANGQPAPLRLPGGLNFRTDDRGVYRIFGLPAGRYLVSVGRGEFGRAGFGGGGGRSGPNGAANAWQRTFYPDALEPSAATPVTVEPGQELTEINLRMTARDTFAIAGRVVDAATGAPVAGVLIGHSKTANPRANRPAPNNNQNPRATQPIVIEEATDAPSNAAGEFRIEGLTAGTFQVYAARDRATGAAEFYSDPVPVELTSSDAAGVEIKLLRGASITGVVTFENANDPNVQAKLPTLLVRAASRGASGGRGGGGGAGMSNEATAQLGPNGSFRLAGLAPGLVSITLIERGAGGLTLLRIERNGADLQNGLRVEAGEQVTGVRLLAAYGTSSIRGVVRVEGGALPAQLRLMVSARRVDASASVRDRGGRNAMVDASGRFQFEQLVAGTYELSVQAPGLGRNAIPPQTISVGQGAAQSAVIPLDLKTLTTQPQRGNGNGGQPGQGPRRIRQ